MSHLPLGLLPVATTSLQREQIRFNIRRNLMIRKIISLHLFAALLALAATNFAMADCATCGGGCDAGSCKLANGGLLGKLSCLSAGCNAGCQSGGCVDGGCNSTLR